MKMKCKKIRNVEKSVCTAEQKIAYNLAFRAHITFGDKFRQAVKNNETSMNLKDYIIQCRDFEMKQWKNNPNYSKYNEDAIFCALNAGLYQYMEKPFIASDYETIGKCFKLVYDVV